MSERLKGYLAALAAVTWWATTGILIRCLVTDYAMPPMLLAWWRNLLMTLGLGAALALFGRKHLRLPAHPWAFLGAYGLVLALFNAVWVLSVQTSGASVATVLLYSSTAFTAVLGWLGWRESLGKWKITAVALSLLGCSFVAKAYTPALWHLHASGIITGLFSGLFFAAYSLLGKSAAHRHFSPWGMLFYGFAVATLFLGAAAVWTPPPLGTPDLWPDLAPIGWGMLVVLALFPTLLGFGFYNVALEHLPASIVNLTATLEPVMTALLAYVLLGEQMNTVQWIGSALVLAAMIAVQLEKENKPANAQATASTAP